MSIHPTAIIRKDVKLGEGVSVVAYAIIEDGVSIGSETVIEPHARLCTGAKIGANCVIASFTVIAGLPQDLHFNKSTVSYVEIGDGTTVRENSTIHRATIADAATKVGKNCLLMASSHIGHDSVLGDNCIQGCFSAIAGFTEIGKDVFISGGVMLHQKLRVGEGCMLSGNSACSLDIPPFVNTYGRNNVAGLNLIGMSRRKMTREQIADVKHAYAEVYAGGSPRKNALEALANGFAKTDVGLRFLKFFEPERHYMQIREQ